MGIVWGLLTACAIGFADLFARRIVHTSGALVAGVSLQAVAIVTSLAAVLVVPSTFAWADLGLGLASGIGMGIGMWGYLGGLERSTATVCAPIVATISTVIPYLYAVARGASVSGLGVMGALLAVAGLIVITVGRTRDDSARRPANVRVGVRWAVISGCGYGFGLSIVLDASDASGSWPAFGQRITAFALIAVACRSAKLDLVPPIGFRTAAIIAGIITGLSTVFYLFGLEVDATGTVIAASVFPAISVLVGRVWYGDALTPRQVGGVAIVVAGVAALAIG